MQNERPAGPKTTYYPERTKLDSLCCHAALCPFVSVCAAKVDGKHGYHFISRKYVLYGKKWQFFTALQHEVLLAQASMSVRPAEREVSSSIRADRRADPLSIFTQGLGLLIAAGVRIEPEAAGTG